jgi:Holliday junction resolvasome RuvABC DNA-binding subunit
MIEYIKGEIVELTPTRMILECGGIGYELNISLNTYSAFGNKTTGKIYIYEVIREDAHLLFGFAEKIERELFLLLTSVSGVGPNTARMILSSLPPSELVQVIGSKNEAALSGLWIMLVVMAGNGVGSMVTRLVDHYVLERPQQKAQAKYDYLYKKAYRQMYPSLKGIYKNIKGFNKAEEKEACGKVANR